MVAIDARSREMMGRMFPGEKIQFPPELNLVLSQLMLGIEGVKESISELPSRFSAEMGLYSQALLEMIAQAESSFQEKQAAGMLAERFGIPQFGLAVPVYNLLIGNLLHSERTADASVQEVRQTITFLQGFLHRIAIILFDEEIESLENEASLDETAPNQFSSEAESDTRTGVQTVVLTAKERFGIKHRALKIRIQELKSQRAGWLSMTERLFVSQRETAVIVGKRYEIDPAMAL